ncbi:hypothetical protein PIB30_061043 [Stylosanthes scabra]|uniref:Uncharacterized protein n=1 Tax=Stylosanthes scabra TaxID=79078 RepID=A0ABU6SM58_9FABA|nr:hypothetical protein [Stylosanthes scabra]
MDGKPIDDGTEKALAAVKNYPSQNGNLPSSKTTFLLLFPHISRKWAFKEAWTWPGKALGIEKCMGKAKEGIGSKGFMKRSKKGGF